MSCKGVKGFCGAPPALGSCRVRVCRARAHGGKTEKESAAFRRGAGSRFSNFLKVAVKHLFVLERQAEEIELGIDPRLVSGAKEFGKIAAFSEWFRMVAFVLASADLLPLINGLSGQGDKALTSAVIGGLIGVHFAAVNSIAKKKLWSVPSTSLNVVVTGSTRGLGKALAREFLREGDRVFITASSSKGVQNTLNDIRESLEAQGKDPSMVMGTDCDVSSPGNAARLASIASNTLGSVDIWVNCAGYSGSFTEFTSMSAETISKIVNTNLLGSLLCTRHAINLMKDQISGGHVFNTEGAGSDFSTTPNYAAYGSTKAAIRQLTNSLQYETKKCEPVVGVHTIQPGMVLTNLLLDGATLKNKKAFNILCEQPETVAAFLVPRMRTVVARKSRSSKLTYLTRMRALEKFLTAPARFGRFFDDYGKRVYPSEHDRLHGRFSKMTARLAGNARDRSKHLATLYSFCMASAFLFLNISESV